MSEDEKEIKQRLKIRLRKKIAFYAKAEGKPVCNLKMVLAVFDILLTDCWLAPNHFTCRGLAVHPSLPKIEGKEPVFKASNINTILKLLHDLQIINLIVSNGSGTLVELIIPDEILVNDKKRLY
jgi:hypothetical protein